MLNDENSKVAMQFEPTIITSITDYSIVIPVYFNENCLHQTMDSLFKQVVLKNPNIKFEIIFVDDGSKDRSYNELLEIYEKYPTLVKIIRFTRNFGQIHAIQAGLQTAIGRCAVITSADGQDPVENINLMLDAHLKEKYEVVICTRISREESQFRIVTSKIFYRIIKLLSFPEMPKGGFDFVLLGPRALKIYLSDYDPYPFFQGKILSMGFPVKSIPYHRQQRIAGSSQWNFHKKVLFFLDGVLSYSFFPLRLMSFIGFIFSSLGILYAFVIFFSFLFLGNPVQGWAPLIISSLVIGGIQILMLGLIGEYLWRTLAHVRRRPLYIIENIIPGRKEHYEKMF